MKKQEVRHQKGREVRKDFAPFSGPVGRDCRARRGAPAVLVAWRPIPAATHYYAVVGEEATKWVEKKTE
jgi:hypothetical protein